MKKIVLYLFFIPFSVTYATSLQSLIKNDNTVLIKLKKVSFINETNLRLGTSEKDEGKNNFSKSGLSLGVRLSPESISSYSFKTKMIENQYNRSRLLLRDQEQKRNSSIINNYINLYYSKHILQKLNIIKVLYNDKKNVFRVMFNKGQGNVSDVLSMSKNIKDLNHKLNEYNNIYRNSLSFLKKITDYTNISPRPLLSINKIISSISKYKDSTLLNKQIADLELEQIKVTSDIEVSESNKIVDFVEFGVEHTVDHDQFSHNETNSKFFVKMSLNLPLGSKDSISNNEKLIKRISSTYGHRTQTNKIDENNANIISELQGNIDLHNDVVSSMIVKEAKKYLKIYSRRKGTSPIKLLGFKEIITKSQLESLELQKLIYNEYIVFLSGRGLLTSDKASRFFQ
jgi:hypothetical protein